MGIPAPYHKNRYHYPRCYEIKEEENETSLGPYVMPLGQALPERCPAWLDCLSLLCCVGIAATVAGSAGGTA